MRIERAAGLHLPLILSSWLINWRKSKYGKRFKTSEFYDLHRPLVESTLEVRPDIFVLKDSEDEEWWSAGWICGDREKNILDYIFVKSELQFNGLAGILLRELFGKDNGLINCTVKPPPKIRNARFVPYLIERG